MIPFDLATERYFALLEQLQQAVIVTDTSGRVLHWSDSASAMYGWSASEAEQRNVLDLTPSSQSRAVADEIMTALREGHVWSGAFDVRSRDGRSFTAYVTDVPLMDDGEVAVGIVGASATTLGAVPVSTVLLRFAKACDAIWPKRVRLDVERAPRGFVAGAEPHVLQLLALLTIRYADALERDAVLDVFVSETIGSAFADFDVDRMASAVYIRITERHARPKYSLLRDEVRSAHPTNFAASLVRMIEGALLVEATPQNQIIHLLLPVKAEGRQ